MEVEDDRTTATQRRDSRFIVRAQGQRIPDEIAANQEVALAIRFVWASVTVKKGSDDMRVPHVSVTPREEELGC
jgi:hypothetical protein